VNNEYDRFLKCKWFPFTGTERAGVHIQKIVVWCWEKNEFCIQWFISIIR